VLPSLADALTHELRDLATADRLRSCPPLAGRDRTAPALDKHPLLSFSSNDYLGLASHPALALAADVAARHSGYGAGASRLVSGDLPEHRALELALANFTGHEAALLFPTGYQANMGLLTALAGRDDLIVSDAANHASIIDGARLSRAQIAVYPHRDVAAARALLATAGTKHRRRLLVTESLFSMDGDLAPLADLAEIARKHDAALLVDEAHAIGALGPGGTGLARAAGIAPDAVVGTLGKALGSHGGFVAGTATLRSFLVNRARSFIFTTAGPAPVAAAATAALTLVMGPEGEQRRTSLLARIDALSDALGLPADRTPIRPFILGADRAALAASGALRARGLFVQAIRPPTVPEGTARLRITLSAAHTADDIQALAAALRELRP
jgi:8-amino-7-oxononanoate synthase